jgi:hypothetical protein
MKPVFLSASVPDSRRDPRYFETGNSVAIRDAVITLVTLVLPQTTLVFGGHPAITPMVKEVADRMNLFERVRMFQSKYFREKYLADLERFRYVEIPAASTLEDSLLEMRTKMIESSEFSTAFFIGGMEGVMAEWHLFSEVKPYVPRLLLATTVGAAKELWNALEVPPGLSPQERSQHLAQVWDLGHKINYTALFTKLLRLSTEHAGENS